MNFISLKSIDDPSQTRPNSEPNPARFFWQLLTPTEILTCRAVCTRWFNLFSDAKVWQPIVSKYSFVDAIDPLIQSDPCTAFIRNQRKISNIHNVRFKKSEYLTKSQLNADTKYIYHLTTWNSELLVHYYLQGDNEQHRRTLFHADKSFEEIKADPWKLGNIKSINGKLIAAAEIKQIGEKTTNASRKFIVELSTQTDPKIIYDEKSTITFLPLLDKILIAELKDFETYFETYLTIIKTDGTLIISKQIEFYDVTTINDKIIIRIQEKLTILDQNLNEIATTNSNQYLGGNLQGFDSTLIFDYYYKFPLHQKKCKWATFSDIFEFNRLNTSEYSLSDPNKLYDRVICFDGPEADSSKIRFSHINDFVFDQYIDHPYARCMTVIGSKIFVASADTITLYDFDV
ncbi:MAG: F-box protein [Parachlamydiales bacterium]|nr:F-box protein [Parachlamydiales bacterium]